ncbi:MAG: sugar transferase [Clostridium sp.]|nr:sugar transferase [Clostridium sp.]MBK5240628.1 sugar transferase [Clostridium sp.]
MNSVKNSMDIEGLEIKKQTKRMYGILKRCFDVIASIIAVIVISPLYLVIAVLVKLDSPGSIFFKHERLGRDGKIIKVYKFRTMVVNAQQILNNMPEEKKMEFEENFKFEDDPRITKVGKFLRQSSLDELPQLINIIKGEMSVVGPRPIVVKELEKYGVYGDKLLTIKPGLTGNWQVNGRSNTTYEERVKFDMDYIDTRNFLGDMVIIAKTVWVVYKKVGAK